MDNTLNDQSIKTHIKLLNLSKINFLIFRLIVCSLIVEIYVTIPTIYNIINKHLSVKKYIG